VNVEGRKSGFQRGSSPRTHQTTLSEINVTPLVDVMLVLLIIFMISAPLMQQGIHVDLPKANAGTLNEIPDQLILSVDKSRQISIANRPIQNGTLRTKLEAIVAAKPKIEVVIQADQNVNYGYVARVMAEVKKAGINRVGLATQPGDTQARL
jgi:biopolymer transport protein TolR